MLHHDFSRRSVLQGTAVAGAGALLTASPFSALAFAQDARWPGVERWLKSWVDRRKVPGMVAALGFGQAAPDYIAAGNRTFEGDGAVGPDTIFRIYSMTKPVTGMAAMICVDEGLFDLDQPLHEILPAFREMKVQKQADGAITADNLEAATRDITIRHLLTHTAGLGYGIVQQGPIREAYNRNGLTPGAVSRLAIAQEMFGRNPAPSLEVFAERLATLPLVYQPGTRWSYSVGLDLMGRVIEVASGMDFDAFLQRRIFDPCGMDSTAFRVARDDVDRLAGNYFIMGGLPIPLDLPRSSVFLDKPAFPFGGAGLVSTARDYDRFLKMLAGYGELEGRRVMSEAAVRIGTSNLLPETLASNGGFAMNGQAMGYGAGGTVGLGDTAGYYGWGGAAGTVGFVDMRFGLRATMMVQYMLTEAYPIQSQFSEIVRTDVMAMAAAREAA